MLWYISTAASADNGRSTKRASNDLWHAEPANFLSGHSHAIAVRPKMRLTICNIGIGLTARSKFVVRKSQKNFGQKNPSRAAATWSVNCQYADLD